MNKKLKFSWAHIIAFVAIIVYAYITFVGATYLFNCKFLLSGLVTFVIVAIIFFLFVGVQQIKGTDEKFSKAIVWERILMGCTIPVFCICLHPFLHTWHVQENHIAVEAQFSNSINAAKQLFGEYEKYSEDRITRYSDLMDRVIGWKGVRGHSEFSRFGFINGLEQEQKNLRLQTLRLQLLSSNYDQLRKNALDWIESADKGASVWNIFLVGNIDQIKAAVDSWEKKLQSDSFSGKVLADEEFDRGNTVFKFDEEGKFITATKDGLDLLRSQFTSTGEPSFKGYLIAFIFYLAFILPYYCQPRSSKNWHRLFGYAKWYNTKNNIGEDEPNEKSEVIVTEKLSSIKREQKTRKKKVKEYDDSQIHFEGIENI